MIIPKTYRGLLKILIAIAENGNEYSGEKKLTNEEMLVIGALIADIQNSLGESQELLEKFGLIYDGTPR